MVRFTIKSYVTWSIKVKLKSCPILNAAILSLLAISAIMCASLSACSKSEATMQRREVTSYVGKSIPVKTPLRMEMDCENGSIDVFKWTNKEVRLEITESLNGMDTEESMKERLKDFDISADESDGMLKVKTQYHGGGRNITGEMNMKIYIPKKVKELKIKQKYGELRFLDDLNCNLDINGESIDIVLNSFEGCLKSKMKLGSLRISEGKLLNGSDVLIGKGNIRIKSDLEAGGEYSFATDSGIIELLLPESLKVLFETVNPIEAYDCDPGENPAKVRFVCKQGKIIANKY